MSAPPIEASRALWNRCKLDLESAEELAQFLDRGEISTWRELFRLASVDPVLRARIHRTVLTVPMAFPYLWLAALASLGENVDFDARLPDDRGAA